MFSSTHIYFCATNVRVVAPVQPRLKHQFSKASQSDNNKKKIFFIIAVVGGEVRRLGLRWICHSGHAEEANSHWSGSRIATIEQGVSQGGRGGACGSRKNKKEAEKCRIFVCHRTFPETSQMHINLWKTTRVQVPGRGLAVAGCRNTSLPFKGGLQLKSQKFEHIFVAVITFPPFFCANTFDTSLLLIVCALR